MMKYDNPILYADYSDPDIVAVGDDFYMVASSFTYFPGVPILHSKDLVHWEIINYAVKSLPYDKYKQPSHGSGTWAPAIRYHNGEFFIFIPLVDEGILVARSKDIMGEFETNMLTHTKGWIDPCPFWDDDGKAYMVFAFAFSRAGIKNVLALIEISPDCMKTIGDYSIIFDGNVVAHTSEGPKMYKRNGYYYVLFPAGGVATGWQSCIRSRDIHGPYEYKCVMHQGNTPVTGPHQGGWVTAPDGSEWFLHFRDVIELGRIIYLEPMVFHEDWPIIGEDINGDGIGEPVGTYRMPVENAPEYSIATSDEFDGEKLGLQWQWQANPVDSNYTFSLKSSCLSLRCLRNEKRENLLWYAPNALTQIPQHDSFQATSFVTLSGDEKGDEAVLGMIGHLYGYISLHYDGEEYSVRIYKGLVSEKTYEGMASEECIEEYPLSSSSIYLRLELRKDKNYLLSFSVDGEHYTVASKVFPLERATWTGAKFAIWSANKENRQSAGYAHFDFVRFS